MPIGGDQAGGGDEVDQLVDAGLAKYGQGDVDGALHAWEQALRMDPDEIRAAAYVDYVRENYEMLAGAPRAGEIAVPFGLGAVPGDGATDSDEDGDYEVEITGFPGALDEPPEPEPSAQTVERYIESVDEGWFLDGEAPPTFAPRGAPAARSDLGSIDLELAPPQRPSSPRQLPLPANPGAADDAVTMEMEADEPEDGASYGPPGEPDRPRRFTPAVVTQVPAPPPPDDVDERTNDFSRAGPWPRTGEMDFADLRTAAPTQEIAAPRGFVRTTRMVPLRARGEETGETGESRPGGGETADAGDTGGFDAEDDKLLTRPGRTTGSPLDLSDMPLGVAPEVLAALTSPGAPGAVTPAAGMRALGADENTKESPFVRVTFNPDTQDLPLPQQPEPAGDDDERTSERGAIRLDTASEPTSERRAYRPEPIDGPVGRAPSGTHPPLVIIEDPLLARTRTEERREGDLLDAADPAPLEFGELGAEPPPTAESRRRRSSTMPNRAPTFDPMLDAASKVRSRRGSSMPPPTAAQTPADEISVRLDAEIEAGAPAAESRAERTRRRVTELIERALAASTRGDHAIAIVALDLALAEDPESAVAQKLVHRHAPAILDCYQRYLGDLGNRPGLAMPMHELHGEKLDIRAAFLLSRVDGALSFEEILDVSGMQRAEAFRHLSNLVLRGILTVG